MAKRKGIRLISTCELCGKPQPKNEKKSNENWDVYDDNVKCECGGAFKIHVDVEE